MVTGTTKKATRAHRIKSRGAGRPTKDETQRIRNIILDAAAALFFTEGYGATSIEEIARRAGMSKRTLYARFKDKPDLFRAVVHRVLERLRPADAGNLFEGKDLESLLDGLARLILRTSLSPDALALYRTVLAEATRFPELALIMNQQGTRAEAIRRIAALLERTGGTNRKTTDAAFAAEQFLQMVTSAPQRRALGLGQPMTESELEAWATNTVALFLNGYLRGKS